MSLSPTDKETIKDVLRQLDWFEHLQASELKALLSGFDTADMVKGEVLITQGKTGETFYIIASGSVGVCLTGKLTERQIATLGAGEFFGEMSLISDAVRSASVICRESGVVYTLMRTTFRKVIMSNPFIGDTIRKVAAERRAEDHAIELSESMGKDMR